MSTILVKILKSALLSILSKLLSEELATKVFKDLLFGLLKIARKRDLIKNTDVDEKIIDDLIEALEKK